MPDTPIDPKAEPISADDLAGDATEAEQPVLKEAQNSGEATTGGAGIATAISQA